MPTATPPGPHTATSPTPALAPIIEALRAMFGPAGPAGLLPGLLVDDDVGWLPATRFIDGSRLDDLLDSSQRRWQASPHAAAALAWKSYSYWLALPAVLGWVSTRRVPLLRPDDVLARLDRAGPNNSSPNPVLGLRRSVEVAVLATDQLAGARLPRVQVFDDEAGLLAALRETLLDAHLTPMLQAVQARARVGARNLRGSVSSGIAYGVLRAAEIVPLETAAHIRTLLSALGVEDLIELVPGPVGQPTVRRKTCCLAFTLPRPRICAGCCIPLSRADPVTSAAARR